VRPWGTCDLDPVVLKLKKQSGSIAFLPDYFFKCVHLVSQKTQEDTNIHLKRMFDFGKKTCGYARF